MSPVAISSASYYHCDVVLIMTSRAYGARSPRYHYDVILIVTSFATPTITGIRTYVCYGHLTALILLIFNCCSIRFVMCVQRCFVTLFLVIFD